VRGPKLVPRVDAVCVSPQPLPINQVRASEFGAEPCAPEALDRVAVERVCVASVRYERASACLGAEDPVGATHVRHLREPSERVGGRLGPAAARRCLNEFAERPAGHVLTDCIAAPNCAAASASS
jgi:hypothetical protein